MCGIVGVAQYKSGVPREIRQKALKILFSDVMLKTETRGEDATGVYQVHEDGDWAMSKKGVKVSEWLFQDAGSTEDPVVYSDFMDSWSQHPIEMTSLVGHCRKATIGSKGRDNDDNHPFAVQLDKKNAILGVHNGTLNNHEVIFNKLPKMLKRQGKVDSESIFHLLFHLSEQGTKPINGEMLKTLGRRLEGSFACVVVNTRFPHIMATFREGRPLEYFMISPLNIVVMASMKSFVESAIEKYDFIRKMLDPELPPLLYDDRTLSDKDYRIFDTSRKFPEGKPTFNDLDAISEKGELRKFNDTLDSSWKAPTSSSSTTGGAYHYSGGTSKAGGSSSAIAAKTSKSTVDDKKASTHKQGPKKGEDDLITTVEVEIGGDEDAKKSFERVRSLGVCTNYATMAEVASSLNTTVVELNKLGPVEVINLAVQAHFNLGYAASKFDSKSQTADVLKKGAAQNKKLEKAESKQQRAQNHVWELKQVITIMLALAEGKYPITMQNIDISMGAFKELSEDRRKDVLKMAGEILGDRNVQKVVQDLYAAYRRAADKKQRRSERTSTANE